MPRRTETVLCDLDGVVWLAHEPIPGSVEAIDTLRESGRRVMFVTNNSVATLAEHEAALAAVGIDAVGDVVSSSMAAAFLVEPGERVLVTGGPGVVEAVRDRGADAVANRDLPADLTPEWIGGFDAVVVGLDRQFDYDRLRVAGAVVLAGARLIGTNRDSTFPTPRGLEPGGGSMVAAIACVGGVDPVFAGKPDRPMADLVLDLVGARPDDLLMVGDRPDTDGQFAERLGCRFALVESGVAPAGEGTHRDLAAVVAALD
ncbi:HAD-IIA family hydrolase [Ilumatobacter nonamiensis]|uniref:HAD-IIA family hydrolase n=1 Tax=Ilumatobacter nonamiensis TaxID=467093 RepID=UPI0009FFD9C8|nr:HAD-IIA family hydrolase [Ilumatobacter nonamiensis]